MKPERKKAIKRLEVLFSEYIRRRAMRDAGGCERCKRLKDSWKELQCCHFHDARIHATKFHELNAAGLCGGCHTYLDSHAVEKVAFFRGRMTTMQFDSLSLMVLMSSRSRPLDYNLTEIYLIQKIKEVSNGS